MTLARCRFLAGPGVALVFGASSEGRRGLAATATRRWAFVALGLLVGCDAARPGAQEIQAPPDVTLEGVRLTHWQHGRLSAYATLASVAYNRTQSRARADHVVVEPVDAQGQVESRLTARTGDGRMSEGLVDLGDGVRWTSEEDEATTAACTIDLRANEARGSQPVTLYGDGYTATGDGFTAELGGERRMTLKGNVRARFDTETGDDL